MTNWIGATEAAERLGIKQASLYAYVSRGVLSRRREADGRTSMFDADEVEELARKGRPRRTGGPTELVIESELTEITPETQRYRGYAATDLALRCSFEDVAVLLWSGSLPSTGDAAAPGDAPAPGDLGAGAGAGSAGAVADTAGAVAGAAVARAGAVAGAAVARAGAVAGGRGWQATAAALAAGRAAQAALPAGTLPLERLQVIVPALAATDQFRLHLDRPAVMAAGKSLIAGMIGALPPTVSAEAVPSGERYQVVSPAQARGAEAGVRGRPRSQPVDLSSRGERSDLAGVTGAVAARLAARLCTGPVLPGLVRVLNAALVLLADHEMAASTLAARVAASMRADPYAVVATGLGAMGGALHGGAALGAELLLSSASSPADAPRVVGDLLRRGERLPGFGHFVYKDGDPRANLLLELVAAYAPASPQLAVAAAVTDEARRRALPEPNIEFALAVLAGVAGMVRGAGEAIFATGRTAGWLAHALEEYERNTPIRPRGVYTGRTVLS